MDVNMKKFVAKYKSLDEKAKRYYLQAKIYEQTVYLHELMQKAEGLEQFYYDRPKNDEYLCDVNKVGLDIQQNMNAFQDGMQNLGKLNRMFIELHTK